jgi:hypothetical protein
MNYYVDRFPLYISYNRNPELVAWLFKERVCIRGHFLRGKCLMKRHIWDAPPDMTDHPVLIKHLKISMISDNTW